MDSILQLDTDLFLYLNSLGTETWDGFWMFVTGKSSWIPLYAILLFFIYKYLGLKKTVITLVVIALLIGITDGVSRYFKFDLLLRQRPCYNLEDQVRLVKDWCGSKGGYFSGHASSAMGIAVFIGLVLKRYIKYIFTIMVLWALFVGYSRIYIGVHYPGDVLTGFVLGVTAGYLMYLLQQKLIKKFG